MRMAAIKAVCKEAKFEVVTEKADQLSPVT